LGLVALFLGGVLVGVTASHHPTLSVIGFLVMLVAAFIPGIGWPALGNTLLAYGFAARIPVVIVMYLAMRGNGGQGWGTHYDAVAPTLAQASFARRFFFEAILPQMTLWIAWTVVVGSILGIIVVSIVRPGKQAAPAAM
jgi:hypothetical protein